MKLRKSANKMEDDLVEALGGFTADASCLQPRQQLFYGEGAMSKSGRLTADIPMMR